MTGHDRHAPGYEPRFDLDYQTGRQGELWVTSICTGLSDDRVEVKTDEKAADTGNLYVEFECFRRGRWHPSGIAVTDANVWVFVLRPDGLALAASTQMLTDVARRYWPAKAVACTRGSHPTRGVAVPIGALVAEVRRRAREVAS